MKRGSVKDSKRFSNRNYYSLLLLVFVLGIGVTFAYTYVNPIPNPGHGGDSVIVDIPGIGEKDLQQGITDGDFGSAAGQGKDIMWTTEQPVSRFNDAPLGCFDQGARLPSVGELRGCALSSLCNPLGGKTTNYLWADDLFGATVSGAHHFAVRLSDGDILNLGSGQSGDIGPFPYRCVS